MEEKNLVNLKKRVLNPHVEFIEQMLIKVQGTSNVEKWQHMLNCITLDRKKMTVDQISKMNSTLLDLKEKLGYKGDQKVISKASYDDSAYGKRDSREVYDQTSNEGYERRPDTSRTTYNYGHTSRITSDYYSRDPRNKAAERSSREASSSSSNRFHSDSPARNFSRSPKRENRNQRFSRSPSSTSREANRDFSRYNKRYQDQYKSSYQPYRRSRSKSPRSKATRSDRNFSDERFEKRSQSTYIDSSRYSRERSQSYFPKQYEPPKKFERVQATDYYRSKSRQPAVSTSVYRSSTSRSLSQEDQFNQTSRSKTDAVIPALPQSRDPRLMARAKELCGESSDNKLLKTVYQNPRPLVIPEPPPSQPKSFNANLKRRYSLYQEPDEGKSAAKEVTVPSDLRQKLQRRMSCYQSMETYSQPKAAPSKEVNFMHETKPPSQLENKAEVSSSQESMSALMHPKFKDVKKLPRIPLKKDVVRLRAPSTKVEAGCKGKAETATTDVLDKVKDFAKYHLPKREDKPEDLVKNLKEVLGQHNFLKIKKLLVRDAGEQSPSVKGPADTAKQFKGSSEVRKVPSDVARKDSQKISKGSPVKSKAIEKNRFVETPKGKTIVYSPKAAKKAVAPSNEYKSKAIKVVESRAIESSPKTTKKAIPLSEECATKVKKRKLNELEKLHLDINGMFDRDEIVHASSQRTAAKPKSDECLRSGFKLRNVSVDLHRLNLSLDNNPFTIDHQFLAENPGITEEFKNEFMEKSSSVNNERTVDKKPKPKVNPQKLGAVKRRKANWSRGILLKKKQNKSKPAKCDGSENEWEDVDEDAAESSNEITIVKLDRLADFMNSFEAKASKPEMKKPKIQVEVKIPVQTPRPPSPPNEEDDNLVIVKPKEFGRIVQDFSATKSPAGILFTCELCLMMATTDQQEFIEHIKTAHSMNMWSQYCFKCSKVMSKAGNSLLGEFRHLVHHVESEAKETLEASGEVARWPVLKVKCLPGDKLSTTVKLPEATSTLSKPEALVKPTQSLVGMVVPITVLQRQKIVKIGNSSASIKFPEIPRFILPKPTVLIKSLATGDVNKPIVKPSSPPTNQSLMRSLRPWIKTDFFMKSVEAAQTMLSNQNCLAAFYKCMNSSCTFFTSDKTLFRKHLELHEQYQREKSFGCAYCNFSAASVDHLMAHYFDMHGYDGYQCYYCFYRAYNDFHVFYQHLNEYHKDQQKRIIECPSLKRNTKLELMAIKKAIPSFVPQLSCVFPVCKAVFYVFKSFLEHLETHQEPLTTKCLKCKEQTSKSSIVAHLCTCYGFGLYQCVYCKFGTNSFDAIDTHIAERHQTKLAIFCQRTLPTMNGKTLDISSIDSLTLKEVNKTSQSCVVTKIFDSELLKNSKQVGNILQNLQLACNDDTDEMQFTLVKDEPDVFVTRPDPIPKSNLQIQNVVSLHDTKLYRKS